MTAVRQLVWNQLLTSEGVARYLGSWLLSKRAGVQKVGDPEAWALPAGLLVGGEQSTFQGTSGHRELRCLQISKHAWQPLQLSGRIDYYYFPAISISQ